MSTIVLFEIADRQTDRQTDMLIAIFRTSTGGGSNKEVVTDF